MKKFQKYFSKKLITWYLTAKRNLPWREISDPYKIWISEIILQQTRVNQGINYYIRFIDKFENLEKLANSTEQEVLKVWEGLGYYRRALHLFETAKKIHFELNGEFPRKVQDLLKLKGIGAYTARAIASLAFGEQVAVVDGNVFRVISRLMNDFTPIDIPSNKAHYQTIADGLLADNDSAIFNQAMIELGALICSPTNPKCSQCPVNEYCMAFKNNTISELPVTNKTKPKKIRYFDFYWIENKQSMVLIKQQEGFGFWKGLWILPCKEVQSFESEAIMNNEIGRIRHIFTHFTMQIRLVSINYRTYKKLPNEIWVSLNEIKNDYPLPKAIHKLLTMKHKQNLFNATP